MSWVFDNLCSWLLEKAAGLFDVINYAIKSIFNLDFDTFLGLFPWMEDLLQIMVYIGVGIVILLVIAGLVLNLLAPITDNFEDPIKLVFRGGLAMILVCLATRIIPYEIEAVKVPYNKISEFMSNDAKSSKYNTDGFMGDWHESGDAASSDSDSGSTPGMRGLVERTKSEMGESDMSIGLGIDDITITLLLLGLVLAIFFNYLKLVLEIAERYMIMCIGVLFSPLIFSSVASKSTERVGPTFLKCMFNEMLLLSLTQIFTQGTILAINRYASSDTAIIGNFSGTNNPGYTLVFFISILAFLIAGQKLDEYMKDLGLDVVRSGTMFNEIRSGMMNAMMLGRAASGAVRGAGKLADRATQIATGGSHKTAGSALGGVASKANDKRMSEKAKTVQNGLGGGTGDKVNGMSDAAKESMNKIQQQFAKGAMNGKDFNSEKMRKIVASATGSGYSDGRFAQGSALDMNGLNNANKIECKDGKIVFSTKDGKSGQIAFGKEPEGKDWTPLTGADGQPMFNPDGSAMQGWIRDTGQKNAMEGLGNQKFASGDQVPLLGKGGALAVSTLDKDGNRISGLDNGGGVVTPNMAKDIMNSIPRANRDKLFNGLPEDKRRELFGEDGAGKDSAWRSRVQSGHAGFNNLPEDRKAAAFSAMAENTIASVDDHGNMKLQSTDANGEAFTLGEIVSPSTAKALNGSGYVLNDGTQSRGFIPSSMADDIAQRMDSGAIASNADAMVGLQNSGQIGAVNVPAAAVIDTAMAKNADLDRGHDFLQGIRTFDGQVTASFIDDMGKTSNVTMSNDEVIKSAFANGQNVCFSNPQDANVGGVDGRASDEKYVGASSLLDACGLDAKDTAISDISMNGDGGLSFNYSGTEDNFVKEGGGTVDIGSIAKGYVASDEYRGPILDSDDYFGCSVQDGSFVASFKTSDGSFFETEIPQEKVIGAAGGDTSKEYDIGNVHEGKNGSLSFDYGSTMQTQYGGSITMDKNGNITATGSHISDNAPNNISDGSIAKMGGASYVGVNDVVDAASFRTGAGVAANGMRVDNGQIVLSTGTGKEYVVSDYNKTGGAGNNPSSKNFRLGDMPDRPKRGVSVISEFKKRDKDPKRKK